MSGTITFETTILSGADDVEQGTSGSVIFGSSDLETPDDPINLVLGGEADPRNIRNALLALNGIRGAPFPPVFPFTCTWSDAIGGLMAGFGAESGWAAGAIQLQCGDYGPIRFHLRLFDMGGVTAGNVHFEVVIPGTASHQVLSWELAEQLITYDLARTGLLTAAPAATSLITPAPTHRAIPGVIYNELPAELRALIGGPAIPVSEAGIANDGRATVFLLGGRAPQAAALTRQQFTINFDQLIPKPFCASGPLDVVRVVGPVTLEQEVDATGEYRMRFEARGDLSVMPFDLSTGRPTGQSLRAAVTESQRARAEESGGEVQGTVEQLLLPHGAPGAGKLRVDVKIGSAWPPKYDRDESCSPR